MAINKEMQKYTIEGLDCAQCANEIETALHKIEGFDGSSVSFATETILIPAGRLNLAKTTVSRIEPHARIIEGKRHDEPDEQSRHDSVHDHTGETEGTTGMKLRIARISLALIIAGVGVVTRDWLHRIPYHSVEYAIFLFAYLLAGGPVLLSAIRNILRGRVFDEMFLMSVATLGAIAIHELAEAVAVMLFYSVGEYVQDLAIGRSRRSISALMDLRPETARLIDGDSAREVDPETIEIGQTVEVRPGERIPLDGELVRGETAVNTSALTGESVPRSVSPGDKVLSGFVNETGTIRIRITKVFGDSAVSRILELVEDAAAHKAPTEKFISQFASVYTPIIVSIAAAIAFLPPLFIPGAMLGDWIYRALVVLVISCPCALVISVPLGYFGGIGGASRRGILIKGANYIDALKNVSTVVVDKTGTLTKGGFRVTETIPRNGFDSQKLLELAATAESHSTHPIARSIREAYNAEIDQATVSDVREDKGYGVVTQINGHTIVAGNDQILHREGIEHTDCDAEGTVVYIALDNTYLGYIVIADEIKPESAHAIREIRAAGVDNVVMLTGDNTTVAKRVSEEVGVDAFYAELLPDKKVEKVEELIAALPARKKLAFVGDGINDAPVLMRSDIGFAMGALGSDAAIEAADIVLMDDRVDGIGVAIRIAHHTRSVVLQNILFALIVKLGFITLGAIGIATMWEAVIADVGVSLLAVLNSTRTLHYSRRVQGDDDSDLKKQRDN